MYMKMFRAAAAFCASLAFLGWMAGGIVGGGFQSQLPIRVAFAVVPVIFSGLIELTARGFRKSARNRVREHVETALSQRSDEALADAKNRMDVAEREWGPLDLFKERDAIEAEQSRLDLGLGGSWGRP